MQWARPARWELAGNLPAFDDGVCHATINLDRLDEECALPGLVANQPREVGRVNTILNNSFGMFGDQLGGECKTSMRKSPFVQRARHPALSDH